MHGDAWWPECDAIVRAGQALACEAVAATGWLLSSGMANERRAPRGGSKKKVTAKKTTAKKTTAKKTTAAKKATQRIAVTQAYEGVALVDAVIARVEDQGFAVLGSCGLPKQAKPQPIPPERLATLEFPGGKPLSPALRRWLAFDARWLGWFEQPSHPAFRPLDLGQFSEQQYGMTWGFDALAKKFLRGQCYALHFGCDSRRFLYVGEPDALGEHPVLLTDTDDCPFLCVEHPGIDVYLGVFAGLVDDADGCYGSLASHPRYRARMKQHQAQALHGYESVELYNDFVLDDEGNPIEYVHVPKGKRPPKDAIEGGAGGQTFWYRRIALPGFEG